MIQDRTLRNLWAEVAELRQRVAELENGGRPPAAPLGYVASNKSNRKTFHRRGCRFTGRFRNVAGSSQEFESRNEAIEAGFRPCKKCAA